MEFNSLYIEKKKKLHEIATVSVITFYRDIFHQLKLELSTILLAGKNMGETRYVKI